MIHPAHIHTHTLTANRTGEYDPTRTLTLRRRFERAMMKRFRGLRGVIREAIVEKDCFGLMDATTPVTQQFNSPARRAFAFPRSDKKVAEFMGWLQRQVDDGVLQTTRMAQVGTGVEAAWTNTYIRDSYKRGVIRSRYELKRAGFEVPTIEQSGGISATMNTPFHIDRLGLLYTRTFTELKGITDNMAQVISRELAQGIADGDHPRLLARKLSATISGKGLGPLGITDRLGRYIPPERRARLLARTEIVRAHHQATMQEYKNWGAQGVRVRAEWMTAGDNRVCPRCETWEINTPQGGYPLQQIEGAIPLHPQCRCIALPVKQNNATRRASGRGVGAARAAQAARTATRQPEPIPIADVPRRVDGSIYHVSANDLNVEVYSQKIVNEYMKRIKRGEKMVPSFVDKNNLSHIVDGSHRAAAFKKLGRPVPITPVDRVHAITEMGTGNLSASQYFKQIGGTL